jgi:glutathione S-transferase
LLTVHHFGRSQTERIPWLCEELGLAYTLRTYERARPDGVAPDDLHALHPHGTAPIIVDGQTILAEPGAVMEYILSTYGDGRLTVPKSDRHYPDYLFWCHFANGSMMANLLVNRVTSSAKAALAPLADVFAAREERAYRLIDERLGIAPYLAGECFTAADITNFFALTTYRQFSRRSIASYTHIRAYLKRVGERPAYRQAMEKCEPGMPLCLD